MPFARYIRRDDPAGAQPDSGDLALAGIGLLGLRGADFEADAFEAGVLGRGERGGDGFEGAARLPA